MFYPRAVRVNTVDTERISQEIAAYSSLTPGDVKNTIDNLIRVMQQHLQASESVKLDGLGIFRLVMVSKGKGVETKEEVSASQAKVTVRFQPTITKNVNGTVATRSMVTGLTFRKFDSALTETPDTDEKPGGNGEGGNQGGGGDTEGGL